MKEIITQMITEYLPVILTAVMTAIVGFVKSKYTKMTALRKMWRLQRLST